MIKATMEALDNFPKPTAPINVNFENARNQEHIIEVTL
jgi:hypothetical protein